MLKKDFEDQFGVDLLPVSSADIYLGEIWEWEGLFNSTLIRLQDDLCNHFRLADDAKAKDLLLKLKKVKKTEANFPDIEVSKDFKSSADLKVPSINLDLGNELSVGSVKRFLFKGVKSKAIIELRPELDDLLNDLKDKNFKHYREKIRTNNVIIQLYYASSVEIAIDKNISNKAEVEAKIKSLGNVDVDVASATEIKFTVGSGDCPFAGQFVKGKEL